MSYVTAKQGPDTRGIGITVAIHAAALTAIVLAPSVVRDVIPEGPLEAFILKPEPKDPPPPPPKPTIDTPPTPRVSTPRPIVDAPLRPVVEPVPFSPPGPLLGSGSGSMGTLIKPELPDIEPPPPPPVMVDAKIDPKYRAAFQPDYPTRELRMDIEGVAVVRVLVGPDGRVKDIQKVSADSDGFWEATRRHALSKWRFRPATRDGVATQGWTTLTVQFRIDA